MPKTFYLTGQNNFGNRGCEALVRSTVLAVRSVLPDARFLVPSADIPRDAAQWPEAAAEGVELVPVPEVPWWLNKWGGLCLRLPAVAGLPWPSLPSNGLDARYIDRADMLLSIGGDNYSLDYGVASMAYFVAVAELAVSRGKPAALWGASVGPFDRMPGVQRHMARHLRRLSFVSVRESRSIGYLAGIGVVSNVVPVVDTAFLMKPQPLDISRFWCGEKGGGVVGVNMSWLVQHVRQQRGIAGDVVAETAKFVARILDQTDFSVLLVPHVAPLDGASLNSDDLVNNRILALVAVSSARVGIVPAGLNAAQIKYVISRCRFLLAARTHATIAAFSTAVPVVSIAYSVKALGINEDLFGHQRYILETPAVSTDTLWAALGVLRSEEGVIRELYKERLPAWRAKAVLGANNFRDLGLWS
jgi:colanic acid/amylovoran biosynthesis protein